MKSNKQYKLPICFLMCVLGLSACNQKIVTADQHVKQLLHQKSESNVCLAALHSSHVFTLGDDSIDDISVVVSISGFTPKAKRLIETLNQSSEINTTWGKLDENTGNTITRFLKTNQLRPTGSSLTVENP